MIMARRDGLLSMPDITGIGGGTPSGRQSYDGSGDGFTIDFLLSALRDAVAAKRLFRNALRDRYHPQPVSSTRI
jgi:hypothetical protein